MLGNQSTFLNITQSALQDLVEPNDVESQIRTGVRENKVDIDQISLNENKLIISLQPFFKAYWWTVL